MCLPWRLLSKLLTCSMSIYINISMLARCNTMEIKLDVCYAWITQMVPFHALRWIWLTLTFLSLNMFQQSYLKYTKYTYWYNINKHIRRDISVCVSNYCYYLIVYLISWHIPDMRNFLSKMYYLTISLFTHVYWYFHRWNISFILFYAKRS